MNAAARRNHKSPRGWKSYVLGAAAVAALLASTACQPGADEGSDDAKASDQPSATGSAKPGKTASTKPGGGSSETGGSDDGGGNGDSGTVAACTAADLGVSATMEQADSEDARHVLITVQNVGDKKCNVYHHPYIEIGDAQAPAPVIEDSRDTDSAETTTIAPGEEAHAALLVAGGARDEYEAKSITLTLQGSKLGSKASGPIDVPMPVDTLYADDGQLVTYWTTASGFALDFIMSK
jgi:hypothetical protein